MAAARQNTSRSLASGGLALFATLVNVLSGVLVTLLAARFLVPSDYGIYTIAAVFMLLLQDLTFTGASHFLVTQDESDGDLFSTGFWSIVIFSLVSSLVLVLAAPLLARLFDAPDLGSMLQFMALAQPVTAYFSWISSILQRKQNMLMFYKLLIFQNITSLFGGLLALLIFQSLIALIIFYYIKAFSGTLFCLIFARQFPRLSVNFRLFQKIFRYSGNLYATRFLQFFSNYGADLVLGAFLSTAAAGIYRLGNRIAVLPIELIGQPVRTFALSQYGAANRSAASFAPITLRLASTMTFLMGCAGFTVAIFGTEIFATFFLPAYLPAVPIVIALVVRSMLGIFDSLVDPMLAAANKTRLVLIHRSIWAGVSVFVILVAAPFGGEVVAWSLAGVMLGASAMAAGLAARHFALNWMVLLRTVARSLALVGLYCAAAYAIRSAALAMFPETWMVLAAGLGACGLVGALALYASIRLGVTDLAVFSSR